MCGIVGMASSIPTNDKEWLALSSEILSHRGPDGYGEWWSEDDRVGLAHRRLSILDLSERGHQPMYCKKNKLTLIFNGEIYNFIELRNQLQRLGHSFISNCDTEVLLASYAEWGLKCLDKFIGMFAFAIYDHKDKSIFIARDRVGEKPLFYFKSNNSIFFASELKALLVKSNIKKSINIEALKNYLTFGYVPKDQCIVRGFNKLPASHAIVFKINDNSFKLWRYWSPPQLNPTDQIDEKNLINELESNLRRAVSRQLVADVPIGILLSGGIDSSLVTAFAANLKNNISTYSVTFPGFKKFDESSHARLVADHFNTNHTELIAEPASAYLISDLAKYYDEPIADSSIIPTFLISQLIRNSCKVALGGDGADELFGGYPYYSRVIWIDKNFSLLPMRMRVAISQFAKKLPLGFKGKNYLQSLGYNFADNIPLINTLFDHQSIKNLLGFETFENIFEKFPYLSTSHKDLDILQRLTRSDFNNYLAEDILVKVDRSSMANSLEVRSPFLDKDLIEFAFKNVPSNFKADSSNKKILLKKLAKKILPKNFDINRKQGFSIPLSDWLKKGSFRDIFWDTLLSNNSIFDKKTIEIILNNQDKGRNNTERLFALVQFELWRTNYNIQL